MLLPKEILIHHDVVDDEITTHILNKCKGVPIKYVSSGAIVVGSSDGLNSAGVSMINKILAGKNVLYLAPGNNTVDVFTMPDDRMLCPHFDRLKLASNGCYFRCEWCYLKLTYRAAYPFICVRLQYDKIKTQLKKRIGKADSPIMFNSGELADSLALEPLTKAGQNLIPWFGTQKKGYLFMLTKSDNVDAILDLAHNGHTVIAWSMNNAYVSRKFEIGAPTFERRLLAAKKVQDAGYPLRIRLDPIIPFDGYQEAYSKTIKKIFDVVTPERITTGTLRFEAGFYNMRNTIMTNSENLMMEEMVPMFEPKLFPGTKRPKAGKYSFSTRKRAEIFKFAIDEIRKHSDCKIALCKESAEVWDMVGLDKSRNNCVCQLDYADMTINDKIT